MKVGLVGLPGSGKSALFRAITRADDGAEPLRTVDVHDERVLDLAQIFKPKRSVFAKVDVQDVPGIGKDSRSEARVMADIRDVDAVAIVLRGFEDATYPHKDGSIDVKRDLDLVQSAFQVADFVHIEARMEKLEVQVKRPTRTQEEDQRQLEVLRKLKAGLEDGGRIEDTQLKLSEEQLIRGFRFLTQKPVLLVVNLPDDGQGEVALKANLEGAGARVLAMRGALEGEIAQLDEEDAATFMAEYGLQQPARDRLVAALYDVLGLCSFLTAGEDECRAWTIRRGATAFEAAGAIHSDIQRGFIRAEVIPCADLLAAGGMREAKAEKMFRLEGKDYVVQDGEIVHFRFSV